MPAVARQRCLHHPAREAAARCPECGHTYCRECITEHDDRVICATCLKKLATAAAQPARPRRNFWPAGQIAGGLLGAWIVFYLAGLVLLSLPDEFHDDRLWQSRLRDAFKMGSFGDE